MTFLRHALMSLLLVAGWLGNVRASVASEAPSRPNIIFLYADDLGYGDLACFGSRIARTPNLDTMALDGTLFRQFYVSHCVCSPTRCSAITGHYPSRHFIYGPIGYLPSNTNRHMPHALDEGAPSLPRALQEAGYRTAMLGKWHLGGGSGQQFRGQPINDPNAPSVIKYGFDVARTSVGNSPTWKNAEPWPQPHDIYPIEDRGWLRWSSRAIVDVIIEFLQQHVREYPHRPFYINGWFKDPHTPFDPTDEMLKPFTHLEEPQRSHYAMVHYMDRQIGRLLLQLDKLRLSENTLILFTSDNGAAQGRGGSNGPLRSWKWQLYEGGIRVPLIVRWPGHVPSGRVDNDSVLNIVDFVPTFCRLSNAEMPGGYQPDGGDISGVLRGKDFCRETPLFWHHPTAPKKGPQLAVREGRWKLLMDTDCSAPELYDVIADVGETNNVAGSHPRIAEQLMSVLIKWYRGLPVSPHGS